VLMNAAELGINHGNPRVGSWSNPLHVKPASEWGPPLLFSPFFQAVCGVAARCHRLVTVPVGRADRYHRLVTVTTSGEGVKVGSKTWGGDGWERRRTWGDPLKGNGLRATSNHRWGRSRRDGGAQPSWQACSKCTLVY
jgi:hypothetical protein